MLTDCGHFAFSGSFSKRTPLQIKNTENDFASFSVFFLFVPVRDNVSALNAVLCLCVLCLSLCKSVSRLHKILLI